MSLAIKAARAGAGNGAARMGRYGDPGLFGFIKGVAKAGFAGLTGGPGAALKSVVQSIGGGGAPMMPPLPMAMVSGPSQGPGTSVIVAPKGGVVGAVQRALPGGATGYEVLACPSGYHANKADYFLKDGTFVARGSKCVRNRRRNPLNPRALRAALGRVDAGKTWQAKLHDVTTAKYTAAGTRK